VVLPGNSFARGGSYLLRTSRHGHKTSNLGIESCKCVLFLFIMMIQ
jgi:hypothetical protein